MEDCSDNRNNCIYHKNASIDETVYSDFSICAGCGLVVGCEWRTSIEGGENHRRNNIIYNENRQLNALDLTTSNVICSSSSSNQILPNNGETKQLKNSSERGLIRGLNEIFVMGDHINLAPSIVDRAKLLYQKIHKPNCMNNSVSAKAAACVLIACRQEGAPRTYKEICAVTNANPNTIELWSKFIVRRMDLIVDATISDDCMSRFCSKLGLPESVTNAAIRILTQANSNEIAINKSPTSIAAASIILACQTKSHKFKLKDVSDVTGISQNTIRIAKHALLLEYQQLFPMGCK
ncbi:transcription initiation factor IIB-like [Teleopsis dalmanni]|uniref:transcription initiation factor IIB-like n=1 Tax=Teleopsis dalmanni TaxID=139649 RepID=UPI000D32B6EF|nr:transcription initiation factor IIB-like [Teleopsis dalmanni]XP_037951898.1 transcription initiation factor IIB-like [Teleopsis dalmanni]